MHPDKTKRAEGAVILENYKKQLNDKMGREKREREEMEAQGLDPRASQMDLMEFMDKRIAAYERNTIPDPKDLQEILDRKSFP